MLYHPGRVSRSHDSSEKILHRDRPGVQKFSTRDYRGWRYEVWRRQLGITIQRAVYSVSIQSPSGDHAAHLRDFRSLEQARKAAEKWIDAVCNSQDMWVQRPVADRAGHAGPAKITNSNNK